jgi:hypothetical protein
MVGIYKSQYFVFNCCLTSEALVFLMGQSMSHQNFYLFYHLGGYFVNMQTAPKCKNIDNYGHSGGCFPMSIDNLKSPDSAD